MHVQLGMFAKNGIPKNMRMDNLKYENGHILKWGIELLNQVLNEPSTSTKLNLECEQVKTWSDRVLLRINKENFLSNEIANFSLMNKAWMSS